MGLEGLPPESESPSPLMHVTQVAQPFHTKGWVMRDSTTGGHGSPQGQGATTRNPCVAQDWNGVVVG